MPISKKFKINGTLIDLGTDGKFGPGSEDRLKAKLDEKKDGEKVFKRLVERGAISIESPKVKQQPKETKTEKDSDKSKKGSKKDNNEDPDPKDEKIYEATGKFEVHHIGGTLFHKADPDGKFIGEINKKEKAHKWAEEQNKTLE